MVWNIICKDTWRLGYSTDRFPGVSDGNSKALLDFSLFFASHIQSVRKLLTLISKKNPESNHFPLFLIPSGVSYTTSCLDCFNQLQTGLLGFTLEPYSLFATQQPEWSIISFLSGTTRWCPRLIFPAPVLKSAIFLRCPASSHWRMILKPRCRHWVCLLLLGCHCF